MAIVQFAKSGEPQPSYSSRDLDSFYALAWLISLLTSSSNFIVELIAMRRCRGFADIAENGKKCLKAFTHFANARPATGHERSHEMATREIGAPGGIRTPGPFLRREVLYPAELRARI